MLNSIESYYNSGFKAGRASRLRDESFRKYEQDWFRQALKLEKEEDRKEIERTWNNGYKDGYGEIRTTYFR